MSKHEPTRPNQEPEQAASGDVGEQAADTGVEQAEPAAEALEARLAAAEAKAQEYWDQLLRARAEQENLRRRSERELENAHKFALERFSQELLPVKDSLEMGLAAASGQGAAQAEKLREGTELTLKMLTAVLEKFGITEVDPLDQPFDPERHQAMAVQESREKAPNRVLAVMQKGYLLNERLLRPAMVIVSKAPAGESDTQS